MSHQALAPQIDAEVQSYIEDSSAFEGSQAEARLLYSVGEEVFQKVLGKLYGVTFDAESGSFLLSEAEDARAEIYEKLLLLLRRCRQDTYCHPIHNFRGLAAIVSYRVFFKRLRKRNGAHTALKKRLRRLLNNPKYGFVTWRTPENKLVCALVDGSKQHPVAANALTKASIANDPAKIQELINKPSLITLSSQTASQGLYRTKLAEVVEIILRRVNSPLEVADLISILAAYHKQFYQSRESYVAVYEPAVLDTFSGPVIDPQLILEAKEILSQKWQVILRLPRRQRMALLLKMNGAYGLDAYIDNDATDDMEVRQLLEMSATEYEEFMDDEKWSDEKIGARIGATQVEVSNLRKAAREYMKRHLRYLESQNNEN